MRKAMILVAAVALLTAACKIETNFEAVINADGSGTLIAELGFDEEAQELLLQGEDPFEGNDLSDLPGAETREETRGDMTYFIIEAPVDDVAELEQGLLQNENALLENFEITVTDTLVTVAGTASGEQLSSEAEGFDPELFEDSVSANIRITMPGRILEHNADSQDGNTLTWAVPLLGGDLDIQAQSDPTGSPAGDGGGFPIWLIALIAVVVVGALAYLFVFRNRGTGVGQPPAAAPEAEGTPPPPPPAE